MLGGSWFVEFELELGIEDRRQFVMKKIFNSCIIYNGVLYCR